MLKNPRHVNHNLLKYSELERPDYIPDGKVFRILFDPSMNMMRILCREPKLLECMRDAFSDDNASYFYVSLHGYDIDKKVYLINQFGYFKPGLFFDVAAYIKNHFGNMDCLYMSNQFREYVSDYIIPLRKYVKNIDKDSFEVMNICDDSGRNEKHPGEEIKMRDYQEEGVRKAIFEGYGRGLVELPTSAGKSLVIANFIYTMEKKVLSGLKYLIFVPNTQLVSQFYKDLINYGFNPKDVTQLVTKTKGGVKFDPSAKVIISNRQYLFKNKDKIPQVDVLINDEVHQSKSKSATIEIVDGMDCKIKLGFSATLPRGKYERLSLAGSFGKVLFVEDITSLQKKGYISKLEINLVKIRDKYVASNRNLTFNEDSVVKFSLNNPIGIKFNEAFDDEIAYINENYGKLYSPIISEMVNLEGNTLVLFDRLEFGKNMYELTKGISFGRGVYYIDGQTPVEQREEARSRLEKTNDNILFGQCSILSTGINIKNLTNLVMLVSTKSFSRVIQSIGRTLRLHKDKDTARLFDISFNFKYSQKHLGERLRIYKTMYHKTPDTSRVIEV